MARYRTREAIRDEIRQRADMVENTHVTDAEINTYIDQSHCALYDQVLMAGEDDFVTSETIATIAGESGYALPDDFYRLAASPPYVNLGTGTLRVLERWSPRNRAALLSVGATGWTPDAPLFYRLGSGDTIELLPAPSGVYSLVVLYVPSLTPLSADDDDIDGRNGWDEWIVLDCAIKCLLKEESDVQALVGERDRCFARIVQASRTKDMTTPDVVTDVGDC